MNPYLAHTSHYAGHGGAGTHTPPPSSYGRLSFPIGTLVKLLYDTPSPKFRAGDIVKITGYKQSPTSITKRDGQINDWEHSDADTVYVFEKRFEVFYDEWVYSDASGPHVVQHTRLSVTPIHGAQVVLSPSQYQREDTVYILDAVRFTRDTRPIRNADTLVVPAGTRCKIEAPTTVHGESGARTILGNNPNMHRRFKYKLKLPYRAYSFSYEVCNHARDMHHFQRLRVEEEMAYNRQSPTVNHLLPCQ